MAKQWLQIENIQGLSSALSEFTKEASGPVARKSIEFELQEGYNTAQRLVLRRTGKLANSIEKVMRSDNHGELIAKENYAGKVEERSPFMRPVFEESQRRFVNNYLNQVTNAWNSRVRKFGG